VLTRIVVWIVKICTRFAASTVLTALVLAIAAGFYTARHFEINTDINKLISPDLDWRQRDIQFDFAGWCSVRGSSKIALDPQG